MTGRIGPNAIIQTLTALEKALGPAPAAELLAKATGRTPQTLPEHMVDEDEVIRLVHAVHDTLGPEQATLVLIESGKLTAEYLIANRIPKFAQVAMKALPASVGLRMLLGAIGKHSWTFAGSAEVKLSFGAIPHLRMRQCPMCRGMRRATPCCDYYAATLEHLVRRLVAARANVREVTCEAAGADACDFAFTR
jgi:divinyl protochlorophyllide a 8-vinyl-reductase